MQPVDGNVVFNKVAIDHIGQTLRILDAYTAPSGGVRFNFDDVTLAPVDAGHHLIELLLGGVSEERGGALEGDVDFADGLGLIETLNLGVDLIYAAGSTLGNGAGLLCLRAGGRGCLGARMRGRLGLLV